MHGQTPGLTSLSPSCSYLYHSVKKQSSGLFTITKLTRSHFSYLFCCAHSVSTILSTIMPAFVNRKRKVCSGHLVARNKRRHLAHENEEVFDCTYDKYHQVSRLQLLPKGEMKDTLNNFTESGHPNVSDGLEPEKEDKTITSVYGSTQHFRTSEVPRSLLKTDDTVKCYEDERFLPLLCHESEYAYSMNCPSEREPRLLDSTTFDSSQSCRVMPQSSSNVLEDYVHRLASLNARACVAAYLQPDKKGSKTTNYHRRYKNQSSSSHDSDDSITLDNGPEEIVLNIENPESKPVVLNVNGVENVIPVITFSGMPMTPCAVVIEGLGEREEYADQVPFNTLGLLHNGDTLYPHARVFMEGNQELHLPSRVLPTLVPARLSTVRRAAKKATSVGVMHRYKKRGKVLYKLHVLIYVYCFNKYFIAGVICQLNHFSSCCLNTTI